MIADLHWLKGMRSGGGDVDPPGGGGDDGGMEERLKALEIDVATIKSSMATRDGLADLRDLMRVSFDAQKNWIIGTALGLGAVGLTVMTFVLNNAVPKAAPAAPAQAAPIIIQVPYPQAAPPAAPSTRAPASKP